MGFFTVGGDGEGFALVEVEGVVEIAGSLVDDGLEVGR